MFGVWEEEEFIGVVLYGRGANNNMLKPYGLTMTQGCELVRVALKSHEAPVSQIVSRSLKLLKKSNPGLQLIVSFADDRQDHVGTIYQAMNWLYTGWVESTPEYFYKGKWRHQRTMNSLRGSLKGLDCPTRPGGKRYRYLYPLTPALRIQLSSLHQPYPRARRDDSVPSSVLEEEGSATLTRALQ